MNDYNQRLSLASHDQLLLWATQQDVSDFPVADDIDWQKSIEMAYYHAIVPQFYHALKHHAISVPQPFMSQLRSLQHNIALENIKLAAELIQITKIFDINHLPYLSIKGPLLSQTLYQNITTRQVCDLDILIDEKNLPPIAKILLDQGYTPRLPLTLLQNSHFRALDNDFTFLHYGKKIMIELHWKLFPSRHQMPLDFQVLYAKHIKVRLQTYEIKTLAADDNLLYLTLHASKHLFEELKWLCDIDRLIRSQSDLDLEALYKQAALLKVQEPFLLALLMSKTLYNTPLPAIIEMKKTKSTEALLNTALRHFQEDFTTLDEGVKKRIRFLFLQELNQDKQNKFLSLFIHLFRPSSVDYIYFNLPEKLNFFYPFLRPVRLLKKYLLQEKR